MLLVLLTVLIIHSNKSVLCLKLKVECGYKQCPPTKEGALNVHLIPHSHMDAGWVKTFDEYYHGTSTAFSTANVQLIYHSVLAELLHDKRRKFTFAETAYFWRWWKEQRPATRATFRSLVLEGQVEFAGGGWVQNDELIAHYTQIIDQYTWGLRKINDTLGPCGKPKASWQIDTYGHSREQTSLLAQMGYDGHFIGRVDHKEREAMIEEDRLEFMWRGSDVLGKMSDIMTHTLYNLYNAPEGFCFDFLCNDEPIVDDPDSLVYNAEKRVNDFIVQIERQAKFYDHDNIMVTMGGDFTYQSAANWFMNMDKIINHVNTHPGNISDINIFYSTPSCYLKAIYLYGRRDKAIYTEKGDHLPYGSDAATYWTGYYTSRPSFKYFIRRAHVFLQIVKQLTVIAKMGDSFELHFLRHAANLVLHHDAITGQVGFRFRERGCDVRSGFLPGAEVIHHYLTRQRSECNGNLCSRPPGFGCCRSVPKSAKFNDSGTSQQHVTNDFIRMLNDAVEACTKKVSHVLSYLTPTWGGARRAKSSQQFTVCHQLNMSQCRFTETQESMLLIVYNPLSIKMYHHIRLPAIALHYSIRDWNDEEVEYQLVPLPAAVINLPGRSSTVIQELCFEAENIPPLGYTAYYISPVRDQLEENEFAKKHMQKEKNLEEPESIPNIANEYIKVSVNKESGLLESIQHVDGVKIEMSQNFYFYSQGQQAQQSGAYCFRPANPRPTVVTQKATFNVIRGQIVKEIRQRFTDWITQIIRLYRGEEFVEFEWIVGPVPIAQVVKALEDKTTDLGKEVVTIYKTNVTSNGQFYTDSNGRQMMKRSCWNETLSQKEKKSVPSCYYPVTSRLCLQAQNSSTGVCVLTDRPQGGTSYVDGEVELMIHRRLLTDDGFGLEETLNEEAYGVGLVVKGRHRVVFGNTRQEIEDLTFWERVSLSARKWQFEPWLFMTSADKVNRRKWQNVRNKRYSSLRIHGLPRHIHVLTLEPWKGGSVLLRLENTLEKPTRGRFRNEKTDGPEDFANKPSHITVQLRQLFVHHKIMKVRETTLAANQWLDDARQMDWSTRYVYQGADDDILPEDNVEYKDTSKPKDSQDDEKEYKEAGNYSEEEQEYSRRSPLYPKNRRAESRNRPRSKAVYEESYRKRRSINVTENIYENTINGTFNEKLNEKNLANSVDISTTATEKDTTLRLNPTTDFATFLFHHTSDKNLTLLKEESTTEKTNLIIHLQNNFKEHQNYGFAKKPRQNYNIFRQKQKINSSSRLMTDFKSSQEWLSSEEDFSVSFKKRGRKKKGVRSLKEGVKNRDVDIKPDLTDDGVTKSIFEMYYKADAMETARNLKSRANSEEVEIVRPRAKNKLQKKPSWSNNAYSKHEFIDPRSSETKVETKDYEDTNTRAEYDTSAEEGRRTLQHRRNKKLNNSNRNDNVNRKGTTGKRVKAEIPFFVTDNGGKNNLKKKKVNRYNSGEDRVVEELMDERSVPPRMASFTPGTQQSDYDGVDVQVEDEEMAEEFEEQRERIKRAADGIEPESPESEEPDYIVTLRPTQIRTFVIHFYPSKGPNYGS